jgi:hypothetical protein
LFVKNDVEWTGGTYRPVIDGSTAGHADLLLCTTNVKVGGTARIAPGTINGTPAHNQTWDIIQAGGSISLLDGAQDPPIDSPNVPYTLVKTNKIWKLES